jgi:transcriptional regulator with XRE-family HTH domain
VRGRKSLTKTALPVAALVKRKRTGQGLNLRDASMSAGISYATMSRIERGFIPDLLTAVKLARWLRCPVETLVLDAASTMQDTVNRAGLDIVSGLIRLLVHYSREQEWDINAVLKQVMETPHVR